MEESQRACASLSSSKHWETLTLEHHHRVQKNTNAGADLRPKNWTTHVLV